MAKQPTEPDKSSKSRTRRPSAKPETSPRPGKGRIRMLAHDGNRDLIYAIREDGNVYQVSVDKEGREISSEFLGYSVPASFRKNEPPPFHAASIGEMLGPDFIVRQPAGTAGVGRAWGIMGPG